MQPRSTEIQIKGQNTTGLSLGAWAGNNKAVAVIYHIKAGQQAFDTAG